MTREEFEQVAEFGAAATMVLLDLKVVLEDIPSDVYSVDLIKGDIQRMEEAHIKLRMYLGKVVR